MMLYKSKKLMAPGRWVFVVLTLHFLAGCAGMMPQPDRTNPIRTIAILPFENGTNEVDAPDRVREALANQLTGMFYQVVDVNETDTILRDQLGVTLGGQLREVELADITRVIQADGIIFGNLTHYDHVVTGVLNEKMVRAELSMIEVRTGGTFWSSNLGVRSRVSDGGLGSMLALAQNIQEAANEDAIQWVEIQIQSNDQGFMGNLLAGIVDKAVGNAFGINLTAETNAFVFNATKTLRNGPGF